MADERADALFMGEAIDLSLRGCGSVSPNPTVGALVVREGEVVGRGWHRRVGEAHAEVNALRDAGASARGATLYVTLEPCRHWGRTPPCTDAILQAGLARVAIAAADPNPQAAGGAALLRERGVEVVEGLLAGEAIRACGPYHKWSRTGLPLVHLKLASSLDGRITGATGRAERITGEAARGRVHRLRAECDAVLTGAGTVLLDDPLLTPRGEEERLRRGRPLRIVLDSRGRIPPSARILASASEESPVLHCVGPSAGPTPGSPHVERLVGEVGSDGVLRLEPLLREFGRRALQSVLLEAGRELASAFLRARAVDRVSWFLAPTLLGEPGAPALGRLFGAAPEASPRLERVSVEEVGGDWLVNGWMPGLQWLEG